MIDLCIAFWVMTVGLFAFLVHREVTEERREAQAKRDLVADLEARDRRSRQVFDALMAITGPRKVQ